MSKCFGKKKKDKKNKTERKVEMYQPTIKESESKTIITQQISHSTYSSTYTANRSISTTSNGSNNLVQNTTALDAIPSSMSFSSRPTFKTSSARTEFFSDLLTPRSNNSNINLNYQSPYANRWKALSSFDKTNPPRTINAPRQKTLPVTYDATVLRQKIDIKVIKNGKFYDQLETKVPIYSTHSKSRGKLLLINNIKFSDGNNRIGAELDETNVKQLFVQMGFTITKYRDLTKKDMENKIIAFRNDRDLAKVDIGAVIIMSHGTGGETSSTQVACVDRQRLDTHWIINQFNSEKCRNLQGKPKIFIFQCCRGNQIDTAYDDISHDAIPIGQSVSRVSSDMLIAYSTIPGFVSHRDPKTGTWYIQAICRIFMEHACDTDVENLLKMVDAALSQLANGTAKQTSTFENRGFSTCYLHP